MVRRSQQLWLQDIRDATGKILERAPSDRSAFTQDEMVQVWVVHHLEIVGEAAAHVGQTIRTEHPDVDWIAITDTRNRLAHGYFDLDLDVLWEVVVRDIPLLNEQIARILREVSEDTLS